MNRTAWLQNRRMQKFRDVLSRRERGRLSMMEAGELLGMRAACNLIASSHRVRARHTPYQRRRSACEWRCVLDENFSQRIRCANSTRQALPQCTSECSDELASPHARPPWLRTADPTRSEVHLLRPRSFRAAACRSVPFSAVSGCNNAPSR
jgi:hypothetical protein